MQKKYLNGLKNQLLLFYGENNEKEKESLLEEKEEIEKELQRLNDKRTLLDEVSKQKKEALHKIKEIDTILNDKKLLEKEYKTRNDKLPEYNKIFSIAHLTEILSKQRKKIMTKMEEESRILDPNYYMKVRSNLEEKKELLDYINLEDKNKKTKKEYSKKKKKVVMNCLRIQIQQAKRKEEIMELIYKFRYYNFIYLDDTTYIKDEEELKEKKKELEYLLIRKAIKEKVMLKITKNESINIQILQKLLETRIINLEKIVFELQEEKLVGYLYDGDILEKKIPIQGINKTDILIKKNKKIKLII